MKNHSLRTLLSAFCFGFVLLLVDTSEPMPALADNTHAVSGASTASGNAASSVSPLDSFWKLYRAKDYAGAANLFDGIIATAHPGATAYYYAALANQQAGKQLRAKQFFNYIITAFPGSAEAVYSRKTLGLPEEGGDAVSDASKSRDDDLPESVKSKLNPGALNSQRSSIAPANIDAASSKTANSVRKVGDHPFSPEQIAREGLNGIDQTNAPNCWFESAMSALAQLPKGQKAISQMITYGQGDTYLVRFPGDGVEYKITKGDLAASGVKNTALWASLLDYAERQKFPNNVGASGPDEDKHRLQVGLGAITGCNAEMIFPRTANKQAVASFIYGAVSSHNPVTCGSAGRDRSIPAPVIESHAYTVIGFEPSKNMITLRNPHGKKARRFSISDDPAHLRFEQLEDGVCKMNLDLFCDAFGSVCRSFM